MIRKTRIVVKKDKGILHKTKKVQLPIHTPIMKHNELSDSESDNNPKIAKIQSHPNLTPFKQFKHYSEKQKTF